MTFDKYRAASESYSDTSFVFLPSLFPCHICRLLVTQFWCRSKKLYKPATSIGSCIIQCEVSYKQVFRMFFIYLQVHTDWIYNINSRLLEIFFPKTEIYPSIIFLCFFLFLLCTLNLKLGAVDGGSYYAWFCWRVFPCLKENVRLSLHALSWWDISFSIN